MSHAHAQVPEGRTPVAAGLGEEEPSGEAVAVDGRFAACFELHYLGVVAYAMRRLPDLAAAEDAAAETFLIAWRRFEEAPPDQLPWLFAIARNVTSNQLRSARRRDQLAARIARDRSVTDQPGDAGGAEEREAESAAVRRALERLSERDREILLLTSWDGLSTNRAAAALGCTTGTFAVRLHRARNRLARALNTPPSTVEESR
jgi:RNA polymerase sigma-70 factor (ECF subfamily)